MEQQHQRYMLHVKPNRTVWIEDPCGRVTITLGTKRRRRLGTTRHPGVRSVRQVAKDLPPDAWQSIQLREGAKGPLVYEFASKRLWLPRKGKASTPIWVIFQRAMTNREEVSSYISNAPQKTSLQDLAMVIGTRWRVEELFEDAKGQLGMADYETRAWTSWHHHMSLVALAHLYVTLTKNEVTQEIPELTLDMAVRMLRSTFAQQTVTEDDAINIIEYHMRRNRVAHDSHRKSWLRKHQRGKPETLL